MIIRYDTKKKGIDEECITLCHFEKVNQERIEKYKDKCKEWIICKDYSKHNKDDRKALLSDNTLCMLYNCNLYKNLLVFPTKEKGWEYFNSLNKSTIIDPDKEAGISYWDIIPKYDYTPTMIGSVSCQRCKYCYGRSKIFAKYIMLGIGDKIIVRQDNYIKCSAVYKNPNFSKKINIQRYFYQLWVNKYEQKLLNITKQLHLNKLYNYLNYR